MDDYLKQNRAMWNELVPIHAKSRFYDVPGFLAGRSSLLPIEREELGDVRGKSLLHLQCHFGMDTLSWARLGAQVTGVDFSDKAIDVARDLASRHASTPSSYVRTSTVCPKSSKGSSMLCSRHMVWSAGFPTWHAGRK